MIVRLLTSWQRYLAMEISASNSSAPAFYALIAAAGSSARMGCETPKQYRKIKGKTVLRHTLETFLSCPGLKEIRVIIDPSHKTLYQNSVVGLQLPDPVIGGDTRNISVYNGIKSLSHVKHSDFVLIHDAARPFIKTEEILAVTRALQNSTAATLAAPVSDTLRRDDGEYVDRSGLWAVQTPQGFHYGLIRKAHETSKSRNVTDDTALVAAMGEDVKIVEGSRRNFKITTPQDWDMAQRLMEGRAGVPRTGFGFDVHAFDPNRKGPLRLCGVDVPHSHALAGHSDADVGLHALTDALLGAIACGDIGQHFPPSDPQWKGSDSAVFLEHAMRLVEKAGGRIANLDITIICEAPKVGPHRTAMQSRIAEICGITPAQVGVKATTTEGLGFTGRGEGIAAQAVATVLVDG
jgi:2-C-methyl-D-erythritol 4-phosphate cytidylyltransferase / 2-C-methyl-D-erythritol 2,4-cyclodiphosphate synthase